MKKLLVNTAIALSCLLAASQAVAASSTAAYPGLYVFGDSLSDAGNVYAATGGAEPVSPPYSDGRFTNGNLWIQDLATSLGLGSVTPSATGGNDFAVGGAQTGPTNAHPYDSTPASLGQQASDLPAQLAVFNIATSDGTTATPGALYALWIGSNDLDALISSIIAGSITTPTAIDTDIQQAIANITDFVNGLSGDGMQNLLVLNVPDLSETPNAIAETGGNPTLLGQIQSLTVDFNTDLSTALTGLAQTDGFALTQIDIFSAMHQVVADPSAYGFTNVTEPCWTGDFTDSTSGTVCSDPSQYLSWDGLHPTAAGHQLVANVVRAAVVPEPSGAALLLAGVAGIILIRRRRG